MILPTIPQSPVRDDLLWGASPTPTTTCWPLWAVTCAGHVLPCARAAPRETGDRGRPSTGPGSEVRLR